MALVQSATGGFAVTSVLPYTSNNTAGNLLLAIIDFNNVVTTPTVSDSQGNVWVQVDTFSNAATGITWLYAAFKCKVGANTVTVGNGSTQAQIIIAEYSDNVFGSAAKNHATGTGTAVSSGAVTTTVANSLLILYGCNTNNNSVTYTGTNGFTNRVLNNSCFLEDQLASATGTYTGTTTCSASVNWNAGIAAFVINAPGFVQGAFHDSGNSGTVGTTTFTSNNTAGNLLIALARFSNATSGTFAITDSQVNTWVPIYNSAFSGPTQRMVAAYALNCHAGANTVTATNTGGAAGFIRMVIGEWSGVPTNATVEGPATLVVGASSVSTTTNNLTTTGTQDLLIAFGSQISAFLATTDSVNNSFVIEQDSAASGYDVTLADKVAAAGTYNITFTYPTATITNAGLIAFMAPPTGGGGAGFEIFGKNFITGHVAQLNQLNCHL